LVPKPTYGCVARHASARGITASASRKGGREADQSPWNASDWCTRADEWSRYANHERPSARLRSPEVFNAGASGTGLSLAPHCPPGEQPSCHRCHVLD
jgi:hypothetical protein